MFKALKTGLLAATALVCAFGAHAETPAKAAAPSPMMWVVKDADSTIYLFGSIHVMKDGTQWLTPAIQSRFDSAQETYFEIDNIDDQAAMMGVVQKYLVNPAGNMTDGLSADEVTKLNALLAPYGLKAENLQSLHKWGVALMLQVQQLQALGYMPKQGVDVTLVAQARAAGKPVKGLETIDDQISAMIPANDEQDMAALRAVLKDSGDMPKLTGELFNAWLAGDEATLTHLLIDKEKAEDPGAYQRVFVARNTAWEPKIEDMLHGKGTVFVTVGAGHLVGPDGLIAQLKKHGIVAQRLP